MRLNALTPLLLCLAAACGRASSPAVDSPHADAVLDSAAARANRERSTSSPEAAMRAFLAALDAQRWHDAAEYLDLPAFERWRREQLEAARKPRTPHRFTAGEMRRGDPGMPLAVAEWQARKANESAERASTTPYLLDEFADVPSLDSLARLDAREAAARWIRANDRRWLSPRELERVRRTECPGDSAALIAAAAETRPDSQMVIGAVRTGDTAFVVLQQVLRHPGEYGREQDDRMLSPTAVRMRRTAEGWVLIDWESWLRAQGGVAFTASCEPSSVEGRRP
jgi:hypothetical protein